MTKKKANYDLLEFTNQVKFFIEKYFKLGLILSAVAIAGSVAWVGMKKVESQKEEESFSKLFMVTKDYRTLKENFEKAETQEKDKANPKKKGEAKTDSQSDEKLVKATGDMDKDYGDIVSGLEAFLSSNKGMQASGEAALTLTEIYEKHDKTAKAAEALSQTLKNWKGSGLLENIMLMRMGDLWSMGGQCDKAVTHWEKLASKNSFLTAQAQLKLGLCFQKLGKNDEAKLWLQKVTSKNAESPAGFSAKKYLRYLNFEKNLKKKNGAEKTAVDQAKRKEKAS